jgi:hypothetical protein
MAKLMQIREIRRQRKILIQLLVSLRRFSDKKNPNNNLMYKYYHRFRSSISSLIELRIAYRLTFSIS